jgi:predicted RNA-binding Zn-ribbon protein involved in translation (DUF1610 family)
MASKIIGRTRCPECGFESAHVKESDKGTLYRYCPNKGEQYFARTDAQRADLLAKTRLVGAPPTATPATGSDTDPSGSAEASPAPAPVPAATPTAPTPPATPKRRGLFG